MGKKVLFVCVGNSARSQMAEAFFNHLAEGKAKAISAGTHPASSVAPVVVKLMKEIGIDLSSGTPKPLTEELLEDVSRVITMGCGVQESCPLNLGLNIDEDWGLEDPIGKSEDEVRKIRDEIQRRVARLLRQL